MHQVACCLCMFAMLVLAGAIRDTPHPGDPPGFEQTTVWSAGTDGYLFYRIPSAVVTTEGTLLVFCEGRRTPWGPHADSGEINILVKRSTDNGRTFSEQTVVWADGPNTCGNPTAVVDEITGRVWLAMTHNVGEDREGQIVRGGSRGTRTVWVSYSDDDGRTWAEPREITSSVKKPDWTWYATGPGVGIQLKRGEHAGRLIIPCNHVAGTTREEGSENSHVIYSDDHGETWHLGGQPPEPNFNESQVVELSDGRVMLNMRNAAPHGRTQAPKNRGVAISNDGGISFDQVWRDEALTEPICQASIVRYSWPDDGGRSRIIFANPAHNTPERINMTVRISYDEGQTWPVQNLVFKGWSSYSSVVPLPDGNVGLLYEAGGRARYERIDFARLSLEWISGGEDSLGPDERVATPAR